MRPKRYLLIRRKTHRKREKGRRMREMREEGKDALRKVDAMNGHVVNVTSAGGLLILAPTPRGLIEKKKDMREGNKKKEKEKRANSSRYKDKGMEEKGRARKRKGQKGKRSEKEKTGDMNDKRRGKGRGKEVERKGEKGKERERKGKERESETKRKRDLGPIEEALRAEVADLTEGTIVDELLNVTNRGSETIGQL